MRYDESFAIGSAKIWEFNSDFSSSLSFQCNPVQPNGNVMPMYQLRVQLSQHGSFLVLCRQGQPWAQRWPPPVGLEVEEPLTVWVCPLLLATGNIYSCSIAETHRCLSPFPQCGPRTSVGFFFFAAGDVGFAVQASCFFWPPAAAARRFTSFLPPLLYVDFHRQSSPPGTHPYSEISNLLWLAPSSHFQSEE